MASKTHSSLRSNVGCVCALLSLGRGECVCVCECGPPQHWKRPSVVEIKARAGEPSLMLKFRLSNERLQKRTARGVCMGVGGVVWCVFGVVWVVCVCFVCCVCLCVYGYVCTVCECLFVCMGVSRCAHWYIVQW